MKIADWNRNTQRTVEHDCAGFEEPILTQIMTYFLQFVSQLFFVILFKTVSSSIQMIMRKKKINFLYQFWQKNITSNKYESVCGAAFLMAW